MLTGELERIRFVTQHYNDLQGLRFAVPLGLITLAWWGGPSPLRAVLLLGAVLLLLGGKRYYRRTFGEVEQQPADPASELCPASIYNPAGALSRLEGFPQVTPIARYLLIAATLALAIFSFFQAIPPNFLVEGGASTGQPLRILLEPAPSIGPPLIKVLDGAAVRSPSMQRAVLAQAMYVLYGSLFLGVWLWRGRRESQSHHLVLGILLLGLSALGTSLGYLARPGGGGMPRIIDLSLPALVGPGVAVLLCGSSMVLAGLLDHWQLVRALGWNAAAREE
jgi:hypothetical protein